MKQEVLTTSFQPTDFDLPLARCLPTVGLLDKGSLNCRVAVKT